MKMRNKGKVHPSPCSSSSSSSAVFSSSDAATFSVLKLLPAAILTIISVLSGEDREVLAYMITRSMKATNPSGFLDEKNRKNSKKNSSSNNNNNNAHKSPSFDCECFECYTSYWVRWDSSPNRELIHQAIEAFEEHLSMGEKSKKGKNKKKDKMGRRGIEERLDFSGPKAVINESPEILQETISVIQDSLRNGETVVETGESSNFPKDEEKEEEGEQQQQIVGAAAAVAVEQPLEKAMVVSGAGSTNHKGLARKVLPDVLGLLNSRLWSLWSPNV